MGLFLMSFVLLLMPSNDLSWGLFLHYSGAAQVMGRSYTVGVIVSACPSEL